MIANLKKNKKKGFTLVELIVVIAIIAIIAAVAVPTTISYVNKATVSTARNEAVELLNNLQTAMTDFSLNDTDKTINRSEFLEVLNANMPDVVHITSVEITVSGDVITVQVNTDAREDGNVVSESKSYDLATLSLSVGSDLASTYNVATSGDATWV